MQYTVESKRRVFCVVACTARAWCGIACEVFERAVAVCDSFIWKRLRSVSPVSLSSKVLGCLHPACGSCPVSNGCSCLVLMATNGDDLAAVQPSGLDARNDGHGFCSLVWRPTPWDRVGIGLVNRSPGGGRVSSELLR